MVDDPILDDRRRDRLSRNWRQVMADVAEHCQRHGRDASDVRIIGVTKYVDAETTAAIIEAGCQDIGENRPQVLWDKAAYIDNLDTERSVDSADRCTVKSDSVTWHMIGHLQRNKVRRLLRNRVWIHSIDSQRLLNAVAVEANQQKKTVPVLLEANISGDSSKTGMSSDELRQLIDELTGQTIQGGVRVMGLMAMAGIATDSRAAQRQFAATREFRDELRQRSGLELPELSMGMSRVFPSAIAEGATMVRIGTRLFASDSVETQ